MNPLVVEFKRKIDELQKLAGELDKDFLAVSSSEESLRIERVVQSLREAGGEIQQVVFLEEERDRRRKAS